jgi:hypothetical protein
MAQIHSTVATVGRSGTTRTHHRSDPFDPLRRLLLLAASVALGLLALALLVPSHAPAQAAKATAHSQAPSPSHLSETPRQSTLDGYDKLPLSFAPNVGQTDQRVRYLVQGTGYSFFFTDEKAVLSFAKPAEEDMTRSPFARGSLLLPFPNDGPASDGLALDLRFLGANPDARLEAGHQAVGTVNHLTGAKSAWKSGLPTYEELAYRELWPGVDMVFRGQGGELKYEFHLRPGADPRDIRLVYAGANGLSVDPDGILTIHTQLGELKDARPVSYQHIDGARVPVDSSYAVQGDGQSGYGFTIGSDYDRSRPLVIDPGLGYSTFVGGTGSDSGRGIAVDDEGSAYVTGQTASADYPTSPGAYDPSYNANVDVFVTKFDRSGSAIAYSTFIGGTAFDSGNGIAVDEEGAAYVAGVTGSPDYPTTPGAFDTSHNGGGDAFVTKLDRSGAALAYSTFLGGAGFSFEGSNGIAVDEQESAYVTGFTGSGAYPTTPGTHDPSHNGRNDVFVTKLNGSGSALAYSTFLGGSTSDTGNGIALDKRGSAYVPGFTASGDYPTTSGALDASHNGGNDPFVTKLDRSGAALAYSTFLGGTASDSGRGIAVDENGKAAYLTGSTDSGDYPTTGDAHDSSYDGDGDGFVAKFNRSASVLVYSTFLGGTGADVGNGIGVDEKAKSVYVTGSTDSGDYPTTADGAAYPPAT